MTKYQVVGPAVVLVAAAIFVALWVQATSGHGAQEPGVEITRSQQETLDEASTLDAAYLRAGEHLLACLGERGVPGASLARGGDGRIEFAWDGAPSREVAQQRGEVFHACYLEHMDDVDRLWQQSDANSRAAIERGRAVLACVSASQPGIVFASTEEELMPQLASLDVTADGVVTRCITDAAGGSSLVRFTPPPR